MGTWRVCLRIGLGLGLGAFLVGMGLAAGAGIVLEPVSPPRTVAPGEVAIHVFSVSNPTSSHLAVELSADVPPGWGTLDLPSIVFLAPGDEEAVFVTVVVPRTAVAGAHIVRLKAAWDSGEAVAEATVHVLAMAAVGLIPPPAGEGEPGATVAYTLTVLNRGNGLDRFLVAASSAHGWPVRSEPQEFTLRPGEKGTIGLFLDLPSSAEPGRDLLTVTVRSTEGAEARAAWFTTILPPGPEAIVGTVFSALEMRLGGRLGYDPLSGRRLSLLTLSGEGEVQGGELGLYLQLTGPWGPDPYSLSRFSLRYLQDWAWVEAGEVGLDLSSLLLSLGGSGMCAGVSSERGEAALLTGWQGDEGRFGIRGAWRGEWGELGVAARETRGTDSVHAGSLWVAGHLGEGLTLRGEGGMALSGLHREAGILVGLTAGTGATLSFQADAYAVGPRLPSPRADRAGISFAGQLAADTVALRFTTRWERDNVLGVALPTVVRSDLTTAVDWSPSGSPLALFATTTVRRSQGFGPGPALDRRNRILDLALAVTDPSFAFRLSGRWRWEEDLVAPSWQRTDEYAQRFTLALGQTKATLSLTEVASIGDGGATPVVSQASVDVLTPAGLALGFRHASDGGRVGIEIPVALSPASSITPRLEVRWDPAGEASSLYAEVGFEHAFIATPPFLPARGWVEGLVFVDDDGNGRLDPGEMGIVGAVLEMDETRVATGADGRFLFPPLAPGAYSLAIGRLPAGFRAQVELPLQVEVALAGRTVVHIPCKRLGEIAGVVYDDQDKSGSRDGGEPGLGRVRVVLAQDGVDVGEALSDPTGAFSFPDLPGGEYWVRVDATSLPERYELTTPVAVVVGLGPGESEEVLFGAWQKPRPVVVVYRPPVADFTWEPTSPQAGQPITFDGGASLGEIVNYRWDFTADGTFDAEGIRVAWTFPEPGFYLVTLVVTDDKDLTGKTELLISVNP